MNSQSKIPCVVMRGGTSKGLIFHKKDLPADTGQWDNILLAAFGSPDPRQIDGLGGSYSTTSKAAIISPSARPGIDIDYTFAQVSVGEPIVDYKSNCGNISSAVGPFAIDEGLVAAMEPLTCVRIFNTNTGKVIEAEVVVLDGKAAVFGDCRIDGVPGSGARIGMGFVDPAGSLTGSLLPSGRPLERLEIPEFGRLEVSMVDAAAPAVFVRAVDVGMSGTESAAQIDAQPELLRRLELIRSAAAEAMGIVDSWEVATQTSPAVPKMAVVSRRQSYETERGETVEAESFDLLARIMSMQKAHRSYALTGAIATAAAAGIEGTIVAEQLDKPLAGSGRLRVGHAAGVMKLDVISSTQNGRQHIAKVVAERTARRLMDGHVYVASDLVK